MKKYNFAIIVCILSLMFICGVSALTEPQFKELNIQCTNDTWLKTNLKPVYMNMTVTNSKFLILNKNVLIGIKYRTLDSNYNFISRNHSRIYIGQLSYWNNIRQSTNSTYFKKLVIDTAKRKSKEVLVSECNLLKIRQDNLKINYSILMNDFKNIILE